MSETKPIKRSRPETENTAQGDAAVPFRDCDRLYACQVTLHCAYRKRCVPCAYKVGCFDVALDQEFCRIIPNQRPEQCPRSKEVRGAEGTLGYTPGMAILTIGDGDFTYSLAIARILHKQATSVIATSYESKESLVKVYPGIKKTIADLEALGVTIGFKVDATRIKETLPSIKDKQFDRIVWNFPCSAIAKGQDGQNEEMEYNKGLVRDFVSNARPLLKEQGQIHLNHKTKVRRNHQSYYLVYHHVLPFLQSLTSALVSYSVYRSSSYINSLLSISGTLKRLPSTPVEPATGPQ